MPEESLTTRIGKWAGGVREKGKKIWPGSGASKQEQVVVQMYGSDWKTLALIGLFILAIQTFIVYPFIMSNLYMGEKSPQSRIEYVSYIDDNGDTGYQAEDRDLNDDGDMIDEGEPADTKIDDPDDAPEGTNVSTALVKEPINRDAGVLVGVVLLYPLLYCIFLIFLVGEKESPMTTAFWLAVGFAIPFILYAIILFFLTFLYELIFGWVGPSLGGLIGGGAAGGVLGTVGDGLISVTNAGTSWATGGELIDNGSASNAIDNMGHAEGQEAGSFLDSQWEMLGASFQIIFLSIFEVFVVFFVVALGVGGADSFIVKLTRGWAYGMGVQLLFVFGIFAIFGVGAMVGAG